MQPTPFTSRSLRSRGARRAAAGAAALTLALTVTPAPAQAPETGSLLGVVTAVNGLPDAPELQIRTGSGQTTVDLSGSTRFELDDDDAVANPAEDAAEAAFAADPSTLVGRFVEARGSLASGPADVVYVESLFEVNGTINAAVTRRGVSQVVVFVPFRGTMRLRLSEQTAVTLDGNPVDLATEARSLRRKKARIHYLPEGNVPVRIEAFSGLERVQGKVGSVDPEQDLLVVKRGRQTVNLTIGDDADVNLDFQDARLSDLQPGMDVVVDSRAESDSLPAVTLVSARTPLPEIFLARAGTAGAASQTLTLQDAGVAQPSLLKANAGSRIQVNGRATTIDRVPENSRIITSVVRRGSIGVIRFLDATVIRRR